MSASATSSGLPFRDRPTGLVASTPEAKDPDRKASRFVLVLMVATGLVLGMVLLPVAGALVLAAILAGVLWPLQGRLTRRLRGRRTLTAGLLTISVIAVLLGPLAALMTFVIRDGTDGLRFVSETVKSERVAELVSRLPPTARAVVRDGMTRLPHTISEMAWRVGAEFGAVAGVAALQAVFMLIALFFLLANGREFVGWLDTASPLGHGQPAELLATVKKVSVAVMGSAVVTAALQALAALVGYLIAGVPNTIFFTAATFFVAFIPVVGAGSVCVVAALLLYATGHGYAALFLAIWGVVVVGLVDNLVNPLLIKRGMEIHGGLVFFALVGGLSAFGAIGILVGPLTVALFLALVRMYHRDFSPEKRTVPRVPGLPSEPRDSRRADPASVDF